MQNIELNKTYRSSFTFMIYNPPTFCFDFLKKSTVQGFQRGDITVVSFALHTIICLNPYMVMRRMGGVLHWSITGSYFDANLTTVSSV